MPLPLLGLHFKDSGPENLPTEEFFSLVLSLGPGEERICRVKVV